METGEIQRYEYSGRVSPRLAFVALSALALAALIGLLYQLVLDANPLILLSPLLTLILGVLVGALSLGTLRQGQVRNRAVACVVVWSLPIFALTFAHLESLRAGRPGFPGLSEALSERIRLGDPHADGEYGMAGSTLILFWVTELLCTLAVAVPLPLMWWNRTVYDETGRSFLARNRVAVRYGPSALAVSRAVREQGVGALLDMELRSHAENSVEGELRFYVHDPDRDGVAWLTVQWYGKLEDPRGRMMQRDIMVLRRVEVRRDYLKALLGY